jgi:hypothetical protein
MYENCTSLFLQNILCSEDSVNFSLQTLDSGSTREHDAFKNNLQHIFQYSVYKRSKRNSKYSPYGNNDPEIRLHFLQNLTLEKLWYDTKNIFSIGLVYGQHKSLYSVGIFLSKAFFCLRTRYNCFASARLSHCASISFLGILFCFIVRIRFIEARKV